MGIRKSKSLKIVKKVKFKIKIWSPMTSYGVDSSKGAANVNNPYDFKNV